MWSKSSIPYETFYGETPEDRFSVVGRLGVGGFSHVFNVVNNRWEQLAAKLPKDPADATAVSSIIHEGAILSQIQGENIIELVHFHNGKVYRDLPPYLILEYADPNLQTVIDLQWVRYGPFSLRQLLDMFLQISHGMRIVNQTHVHCDLRPSNIFLVGDRLKIADFGVAEEIGQSMHSSQFRRYRRWDYVAPEYWTGTNLGPEMDIYSAGLIFYSAATFNYPFDVSPEGEDEAAYQDAHTTQAPKNLRNWNPQILPALADLILRMIEKNPEDRFHAWSHIIRELESIRDTLLPI
jgi:eukaryotic-like serine/threonine-protein kinase